MTFNIAGNLIQFNSLINRIKVSIIQLANTEDKHFCLMVVLTRDVQFKPKKMFQVYPKLYISRHIWASLKMHQEI